MTRILVTGGAGNIGSALVERLIRRPNTETVVIDSLLTGSVTKLPPVNTPGFTFIKGDVNDYRDISVIMQSYKFDYVFHYAAVVGVQRTLEKPIMVLRDIDGIRNVLDLCKNTGVKRVFFSSSSEVYGEPVEFPQNELTTPLNSRLPYAVVKNVGEAFLRSYHLEYGLPFTIFRFFNTYGPRQSDDFVITRFIKQALAGDDLTVYGDGKQSRTFCYIDDNIDTVIKCLDARLGVNDVINVGNDQEFAVRQLADLLITITGSKSQVRHLPALTEGDMTRRKPDIAKMKQILGRPLTSLEQGIRNTIEKRMF
jgi:nucleoside-diphosphate-sugar epimerase